MAAAAAARSDRSVIAYLDGNYLLCQQLLTQAGPHERSYKLALIAAAAGVQLGNSSEVFATLNTIPPRNEWYGHAQLLRAAMYSVEGKKDEYLPRLQHLAVGDSSVAITAQRCLQ